MVIMISAMWIATWVTTQKKKKILANLRYHPKMTLMVLEPPN